MVASQSGWMYSIWSKGISVRSVGSWPNPSKREDSATDSGRGDAVEEGVCVVHPVQISSTDKKIANIRFIS